MLSPLARQGWGTMLNRKTTSCSELTELCREQTLNAPVKLQSADAVVHPIGHDRAAPRTEQRLDRVREGGGDVRRQVGIPLTCGSQHFRPFASHSLKVASAKSLNRQTQVGRFAGVALRTAFHSRRAPGYASL